MRDQPGFFDVDDRLKRLSDLGDQLEGFRAAVDFEMFRPDLDAALAYSDGAQGGRPPFDPVMMFKVLVIQTTNNLSDERAEFLINDRLSFMRFLDLDYRIASPMRGRRRARQLNEPRGVRPRDVEMERAGVRAPLNNEDGLPPNQVEYKIRRFVNDYLQPPKVTRKYEIAQRRFAEIRADLPRLVARDAHELMRALEVHSILDCADMAAATLSLAELKSPHAASPLLTLVDHEFAEVRIAARRGLRNLRVEASLAPGLKALSNPDARVRREAVGALAYLKCEATLPALIGAAKDANFEERRAATAALAFATPERTTPTILAGLDGVHYLTGGTHHSVAIEQRDHIVLVEAPLNEERTLVLIDKIKELIPNKPIKYVVNSHVHFDHSGGLRTFIDTDAII